MKKKASDIVKRALDLADIANTDFLTHREHTEYLNDAWKSVYQWLINKGDKQFIKEVSLGGANFGSITEYELPNDLYQILSLKDGNSGRIIPRHTESESISSNTYEIVNDKLRLYGTTATNLVLTYYMTPVYITFPEPDLIFEPESDIVDTAGDCVLYDTGVVQNVITGETFGPIEPPEGFYMESMHLGLNHYARYKDWNGMEVQWYNWNNELIGEYAMSIDHDQGFHLDYAGRRVLIDTGDRLIFAGKILKTLNPAASYYTSADPYYMGILKDCYIVSHYLLNTTRDGHLLTIRDYDNNIITEIKITGGNNVWERYCRPIGDNRLVLIWGDTHIIIEYDPETGNVRTYDISEDIIGWNKVIDYGVINNTGAFIVHSLIEDTEFNFPNELFYSLLSADLAMRYAMKQNADFSGLTQLYQSMKDTYMNSLSQDGGYTRIKNIYRG